MKFFLKLIPALLFWTLFIGIVLKVPYPDSLTQANSYQIIPFLISLFLAITFTLNFFLRNILTSASIGLGLIFLLILKALDALNIVTGGAIFIAILLLISYFKKNKKSHVPKQSKISRLRSL